MSKSEKNSNHLIHETSPYLKAHAHNPVDWYPWGNEALNLAKKLQKPIFLSIGYSACHWCHVMEEESFENADIAKELNDNFVSIKVDREERPDLDAIYMSAVQLMRQQGGWPLSVFLTPDLKPFFGGTYFPPEDRMGLPGFLNLLKKIHAAWTQKKTEIMKTASELTAALEQVNQHAQGGQTKAAIKEILSHAAEKIYSHVDSEHGGFGGAPKFFHVMEQKFLLRMSEHNSEYLKAVDMTLQKISHGGIYDHLGGGFHRYSTDARWHVPHFEKMLYDNALLVPLFLEGFQKTNNESHLKTVKGTLDFILRDLRSPEGTFYSALDADTDGKEGKFYVWTKREIQDVLGVETSELFCRAFGVTASGNWEETNVLVKNPDLGEIADTARIDRPIFERLVAEASKKLHKAREERTKPLCDDKQIVSWNAMTIEALAMTYQVTQNKEYLDAASRAAQFLISEMSLVAEKKVKPDETFLFHSYAQGKARFSAYLDDYVFLISALTKLYESDFQMSWLTAAEKLAERVLSDFYDSKSPGFFYTGKSHEKLILRTKEVQDGATPSSTGVAVYALNRLGRLLSRMDFLEPADKVLSNYSQFVESYPHASGQLLLGLFAHQQKPRELVLATSSEPELHAALELFHTHFIPNVTLLKSDQNGPSPARNRPPQGKEITAYVCEGQTCSLPITGSANVKKLIQSL